jgi:carbamate kinase
MRVVVALGGNALLKRGEPMTADRFVERTGNRAAIGALGEIEAIVDGAAGTQVVAS